MREKKKKVLFVLLALIVCLTFSTPAMAEESMPSVSQTRMSGFGQSNGTTSFYVPVSGSSSSAGITIKALNCPSAAYIVASIYRPDGSLITMSVPNGLGFIQIKPGDSDYLNRFQFNNAPVGNYRVEFSSSTPVNILCWIYG